MSVTTSPPARVGAVVTGAAGEEGRRRRRARSRLFAGARLTLAAAAISLLSSGLLLLVAAMFLPRSGQVVLQGAILIGHHSLLSELMSWDAWWYQAIATHGYSWNAHNPAQQTPAFFPLYPLVERAGSVVTRLPTAWVAVGASIGFQAGAAAVLAQISRRQGADDARALCWVVLFVVSPPVVFDLMGYYSALFCLLAFLAVFFCQGERRWLAALSVGLASATNPLGVAVSIAFVIWALIELAATRSFTRRAVASLVGQSVLAFGGVLAFMFALWEAFGDPLAFYQANGAWAPSTPLGSELQGILSFSPLRRSVTSWASSPYGPQAFSFVIDSIAAVLVVAVIVALLASKGGARSFGFWALLSSFLLVQLACARYGNEASTTRFLIPLVFGAGAASPLHRVLVRPVVAVLLICVLGICTVFFLQRLATGQWID